MLCKLVQLYISISEETLQVKTNSRVGLIVFFVLSLTLFLGCGGDDGGSSDLGSICVAAWFF